MSSRESARVRMYRQGFGDCFLLTLPRAGAAPFHCLIDCGVLMGTSDATTVMTRVAQNISAETRGRLDVVVVTHEHWDHLSGFLQARDVFDQMTIGELWFAWTEDPADPLANRLRQMRHHAQRSAREMATRMAALNVASAERLTEVLSFFGTASGPDTRDALDYLVNHPSQPAIRYFGPGGAPLPVASSTRVYVLGPPRDAASLRENDGHAGHDVYSFGPGLAYFIAAADASGLAESEDDKPQPFAERYRVSRDQAERMPFFQYNYLRAADDWRCIDADWLDVTEQLLLALDNHTNNTSLALAFELEPGGRVLLFPGDAQVGNWLSWDQYVWNSGSYEGASTSTLDLLRRTVVYKVGHHASHNATKGLERMTSPDLVVLIPVDGEMARKKTWNIPFPGLYRRLYEAAGGRVIRADVGLPQKPPGAREAHWRAFLEKVAVGPEDLYYDVYL